VKYICYFAGWFEVDTARTNFRDHNDVVKTGNEWLAEGKDIQELQMESFEDASSEALDGEFDELEVKMESE